MRLGEKVGLKNVGKKGNCERLRRLGSRAQSMQYVEMTPGPQREAQNTLRGGGGREGTL